MKMESCGVCEHCSIAMRSDDVVSRGGYSYHRKCHKCYVCSETDLQDAEVFRGVIFCASCAKRIFKGCATARTTKTSPPPAPPRRRRRNMSRSVIERARAAADRSAHSHTDSFSNTTTARPKPPAVSDCYCISDVITQAKKLINLIYYQSQNFMLNGSSDTADTTEMCHKVLQILKYPSEPAPHEPAYTASRATTTVKSDASKSATGFLGPDRVWKEKSDGPCSDLRMAEIGASTEIATMALRKKSRKRVQSKSKYKRNTNRNAYYTMSVNKDSVLSQTTDEESFNTDSEYKSKESDPGILHHTVASVLKMPYKFFKNKVLERSSLVSIIMATDEEDTTLCGRLKTLFQEDMIHRNGYKKLYSTINKKQVPYKLGWLDPARPENLKSDPCKHFHECHSYRCMREHAMRLAGPTKSKIDGFRRNLKKVIVPSFFNHLSIQYKNPAMIKSTACGSDSRPHKTGTGHHTNEVRPNRQISDVFIPTKTKIRSNTKNGHSVRYVHNSYKV